MSSTKSHMYMLKTGCSIFCGHCMYRQVTCRERIDMILIYFYFCSNKHLLTCKDIMATYIEKVHDSVNYSDKHRMSADRWQTSLINTGCQLTDGKLL